MSPRAFLTDAPAPGAAVRVAPGILWLRFDLPMALDHVNVFALEDDDGWTIIDTGFDTPKTRAAWGLALAGPLAGKPVVRVLVTHYHPDHIGLAGWFQAQGAQLLTTRTSWLYARMLVLDVQDKPLPQTLEFWRMAGMDAETFARRAAERPFNFADVVSPLPMGFTRLVEGQVLHLAGRDWIVRIGHGHAPEHATLWSLSDDLVIGGDQFLPGISANIGVYPSEPEADPLGEWLDSCEGFKAQAEARHKVLPGHKLPFTGLPTRLGQMIEHHQAALGRLRDFLLQPRSACECFQPLFARRITPELHGFALVEAVAHLNHLAARGEVARLPGHEGSVLWQMR